MKSNSVQATVTIKQDPENPVPQEVLAQAIVSISASMKRLLKSGLNHKAIVALLRDDCGQHKYVIERVLESLEGLAKNYTSK